MVISGTGDVWGSSCVPPPPRPYQGVINSPSYYVQADLSVQRSNLEGGENTEGEEMVVL